jgi:hypothetical protein
MDADQLKLLLRQRAEALAPNATVIDRALARCARIGLRQSAASGRQGTSSLVTVVSQPPAASSQQPAASSQQPAASGQQPAASSQQPLQPVTIPSLSAAPAEAVPAGQLAPGRIIAGYRIEGLLGKGGMGSVYRATQLSMNRPIAFKVLAARLAGDPAFVERFRREARAAGRLHHPNLVTVHDSGEADGLVFFSMELVEGRSLKTVIKERGRLPADEALRITRQALEALAYAHGKGVVHRDIKPDNLMLMANGQIKVADLGLSRIDEGGDGAVTNLFETTAGSFMGSPRYMAPEQGRDAHSADQRSDLYSLGATLYHLVCGQPPFNGGTAMEVLIAAQEHPLAWPEAPPPAPLRELIARLLEKDPAQRPRDALAAIAALDCLLTPQGGMLPVPHRRSWRGALLTAAFLAITTLALLVAFERVRENARERTWGETLAAAESTAGDKRFAEALEQLHRARPLLRDGSPRAVTCDEAIARFTKAWDAWAAAQVAGVERAVREHLAAGRYSEAIGALRKVPDSWRSPAAEPRLETLQKDWEEAVARDAERRPESQSRGLLDDMRERRAEIWRKVRAEPAEAMQLRDGVALFSGSGRGRLPLPGPGHGPLALRLAWRGKAPADAVWRLSAGGVEFVLHADTAELAGQPLVRGEDGTFGLVLVRRIDGLVLMARGRNGPLFQPVTGEPVLSWSLGTGEVEATLGRK